MTNFPTSLDDATSIPVESAGTALATNHITSHQNVQDAIEAIEAKVGVDGSAVTTSHDYKLSGVTGTDKAVSLTGTEALTNKTLTAPTITSPKVTVGSDAVGDLHYVSNVDGTLSRLAKGTDNQILKMNGTSLNWEAETSTVNADQTTAGIVEEATAAEITAGTATGGSGASLYVSPDQLALSTPVFDGSGLTNISGKANVTTSNTAISSSVAETTIATQSIPGGTLGTSNAIRVTCYVTALNVQSSSDNVIFRFKYGATTVITKQLGTNATYGNASNYEGKIEFLLFGAGTTGTQEGVANLLFGYTGGDVFGNGGGTASGYPAIIHTKVGTASEDSTASKTLEITAQFSTSGANHNITVSQVVMEKIR